MRVAFLQTLGDAALFVNSASLAPTCRGIVTLFQTFLRKRNQSE